MNFFNFIAEPLGNLLTYIYANIAFNSYGWAIVIFTILVKLILMPLTVKQYKSTARMQELQPQMQEIQKRYKNDREKLNEELMKFYQENKYNPASGCLPILIQMPILFALFSVMSRPLTYMLDLGDKIDSISSSLKAVNPNFRTSSYLETDILNGISTKIAGEIKNVDPGIIEKILDFKGHMNFLGVNLGAVPSYHPSDLFGNHALQYWLLFLIPVLAVITTFISTRLSIPKSNSKGPEQAMQRNMLFIGPIMTLIFSFLAPAGLGLYWIVGYVFQIFQQLFINKFVIHKKKEVVVK